MSWITKLEDPYSTWDYTNLFTVSGDEIHATSPAAAEDTYASQSVCSKSFTLTRRATYAKLKVHVKRLRQQWLNWKGNARAWCVLEMPTGARVTLFDTNGTTSGYAIPANDMNIATYCRWAGTYTLYLYSDVVSVWNESTSAWMQSYVYYDDMYLKIDNVIEKDLEVERLTLSDAHPPVTQLMLYEDLSLTVNDLLECAKERNVVESLVLTDVGPTLQLVTPKIPAMTVETLELEDKDLIFQTLHALTTKEEIILAGVKPSAGGGMLHHFEEGTEMATYDTDDEDFGAPNIMKTLAEVTLESHRPIRSSVTLYVSTDSGNTWQVVESSNVIRGTVAHFYPWITGEKFRLRFMSSALYFHAWEAQAVPRGAAANPVYDGDVYESYEVELGESLTLIDASPAPIIHIPEWTVETLNFIVGGLHTASHGCATASRIILVGNYLDIYDSAGALQSSTSLAAFTGGTRGVCTDGTYVYVCGDIAAGGYLVNKYLLADGSLVLSSGTLFGDTHLGAIQYAAGNLWFSANYNYHMFKMDAATLVVLDSYSMATDYMWYEFAIDEDGTYFWTVERTPRTGMATSSRLARRTLSSGTLATAGPSFSGATEKYDDICYWKNGAEARLFLGKYSNLGDTQGAKANPNTCLTYYDPVYYDQLTPGLVFTDGTWIYTGRADRLDRRYMNDFSEDPTVQ